MNNSEFSYQVLNFKILLQHTCDPAHLSTFYHTSNNDTTLVDPLPNMFESVSCTRQKLFITKLQWSVDRERICYYHNDSIKFVIHTISFTEVTFEHIPLPTPLQFFPQDFNQRAYSLIATT